MNNTNPRRNTIASLKRSMHINIQTLIEEFRLTLLEREKLIQEQREEIERLRSLLYKQL